MLQIVIVSIVKDRSEEFQALNIPCTEISTKANLAMII